MLLLAGRARGLAALRVGPVGARRVKAVALGGAALMATTQQKEADCAAGQNLRVASYNVLSSKLCEPGYFVKCAKENLDPPTRLKRVQALLETETKKNAAEIHSAIVARQKAKANGDFVKADQIRDELKGIGIELIDKPGGKTDWIKGIFKFRPGLLDPPLTFPKVVTTAT